MANYIDELQSIIEQQLGTFSKKEHDERLQRAALNNPTVQAVRAEREGQQVANRGFKSQVASADAKAKKATAEREGQQVANRGFKSQVASAKNAAAEREGQQITKRGFNSQTATPEARAKRATEREGQQIANRGFKSQAAENEPGMLAKATKYIKKAAEEHGPVAAGVAGGLAAGAGAVALRNRLKNAKK